MKTECILLWNPFFLKIPVNGELRWVSISWTLPDLINFSELFMSLSLDPVKIFWEKVGAILASMSYSRTLNSSVVNLCIKEQKRQSHLQFQSEIHRRNYKVDDLGILNWKLVVNSAELVPVPSFIVQVLFWWQKKHTLIEFQIKSFSNFSCMFLNPNNFFQFEL